MTSPLAGIFLGDSALERSAHLAASARSTAWNLLLLQLPQVPTGRRPAGGRRKAPGKSAFQIHQRDHDQSGLLRRMWVEVNYSKRSVEANCSRITHGAAGGGSFQNRWLLVGSRLLQYSYGTLNLWQTRTVLPTVRQSSSFARLPKPM
jgi:hypothetical protein